MSYSGIPQKDSSLVDALEHYNQKIFKSWLDINYKLEVQETSKKLKEYCKHKGINEKQFKKEITI